MTATGNVPIEQLRAGDKVFAVDVYGDISIVSVHKLLVHENSEIYELESEMGTLRTTAEHPFWVGMDKYVEVSNLNVGDKIVHVKDGTLTYIPITNIRPTGEFETVYNITVDEPNTYIADGIVVHNKR